MGPRSNDFAYRQNLIMGLVVVALCLTTEARAGRARSDRAEALISQCIAKSAAQRAWLSHTLWGLRDQEAGWIGAEVLNRNGSHDLGPMQVNSWWVPKIAALVGRTEAKVRYWLRYDACFNVDAARWIFLSALRQKGDYWEAIGTYHSPTAWRKIRYAKDVASKIRRRRFGN